MKLKKLLLFVSIMFFWSGCVNTTTNVTTSSQNINEIAKYKGPKARIAVASFKCKAAKCNGAIGSGIADMLTTALFNSGKFIVLERSKEGFGSVEKELQLSQGIIRQNKQYNNLEGADILVVGAITAFEPKAAGIGAGGIVIPRGVPFIGGIKFGKDEAYIAADLRLIDVKTGRIINATTVEGQASKWNIGGAGGGATNSLILGGGLSTYKNTPMEKAVRDMINKAVEKISQLVPENYYRYKPNNQTIQNINQSVINNNNQTLKPKAKIVFKEDFEKYGIGQHTPFGSITGNGFIQLGINKYNQTSKILKIDNNYICINKKFKNFILTFDAKPNEFGTVNIFFRYSRNNKVGYKLNDYDHWNFKLIKVATTSESVFAESQIKNLRKPNKWYLVKIIANNHNIKAFYDNRLIVDVNDKDPYFNKSGQICIQAPYNVVLVDNIKIYQIK